MPTPSRRPSTWARVPASARRTWNRRRPATGSRLCWVEDRGRLRHPVAGDGVDESRPPQQAGRQWTPGPSRPRVAPGRRPRGPADECPDESGGGWGWDGEILPGQPRHHGLADALPVGGLSGREDHAVHEVRVARAPRDHEEVEELVGAEDPRPENRPAREVDQGAGTVKSSPAGK